MRVGKGGEIMADVISKEIVIAKLESIYDVAWGEDIPHPTIPEYRELHDNIRKIMNKIADTVIEVERL